MPEKPSTLSGLNQEFPERLADELARKYGAMNAVALKIIADKLVPAIRTGSNAEIFAAIVLVEAALAIAFPDSKIRDEARSVATIQNDRHRRLFFDALQKQLNVEVIGSDEPGTEINVPTFLPTAALPRPGSVRLVVRANMSPQLLNDQFVDDNVRLVSTLRQGVLDGLGDSVTRSVMLGEGIEGEDLGPNPTRDELADRLLDKWQRSGVPSKIPIRRLRKDGSPVLITLENHAALIARDQVSKLNGQLNRTRQTAAGITKFVWETQKDARGRSQQAALQSRTFTWADGAPGVGIPGQPIQCRCWGRAVVDRAQVLSDGDFINIDDPNVRGEVLTERPGLEANDPGPGAAL